MKEDHKWDPERGVCSRLALGGRVGHVWNGSLDGFVCRPIVMIPGGAVRAGLRTKSVDILQGLILEQALMRTKHGPFFLSAGREKRRQDPTPTPRISNVSNDRQLGYAEGCMAAGPAPRPATASFYVGFTGP